MSTHTGVRPRPSASRLVCVLGVTQILAWGTTFYLPAVLAAPTVRDTGWPLATVVAGLSWGLLISGSCSPKVGRLIDRFGGRHVLSASSVLIALGLLAMSLAQQLPVYFAAWTLIGVGMAAGLYDATFATLGRLLGESARPAITGLTLLGGLASTLAWPAMVALEAAWGWRATCQIIAGAHLLVALPIHYWLVPPPAPVDQTMAGAASGGPLRRRLRLLEEPAFLALALIFTALAFVMTSLSVHLLSILAYFGLDAATAVTVGMLIGPAQVAARIGEFTLGRNLHPVWSARTGLLLCLLGLGLLWTAGPAAAFVAVALYGAGNGIMTIARGTLPLALYGSQGYGERMGLLARPILIAQAAAPVAAALLLQHLGVPTFLMLCTGLLVLGLGGMVWAVAAGRPPAHAAETSP